MNVLAHLEVSGSAGRVSDQDALQHFEAFPDSEVVEEGAPLTLEYGKAKNVEADIVCLRVDQCPRGE